MPVCAAGACVIVAARAAASALKRARSSDEIPAPGRNVLTSTRPRSTAIDDATTV
jgi:hypothetical protein